MISIESTAKTVQQAIEDGLNQLGKTIDEVDIDILSSGGFLKKARVQITVTEDISAKSATKSNADSATKPAAKDKAEDAKPVTKPVNSANSESKPANGGGKTEVNNPKTADAARDNNTKIEDKAKQEEKAQQKPLKPSKPNNSAANSAVNSANNSAGNSAANSSKENKEKREGGQNETRQKPQRSGGQIRTTEDRNNRERSNRTTDTADRNDRADRPARERTEKHEEERRERPRTPITDEVAAAATEFVTELLSKMKAEYTMESAVMDGELTLCIKCDSGAIIGYRGETLDSIEYLTSLAINKSDDKYYRINVDCNDYRSKRVETLTALARRMAEKAVKTGRKVVMEAMNSSSRKVIHSVLASNDRIITKSEGREPQRRIIIIPKRFK